MIVILIIIFIIIIVIIIIIVVIPYLSLCQHGTHLVLYYEMLI